jgi:hypothetical protein
MGRVTVPTLVVYAEKGMFTAEEKSEFVDCGPEVRRVDLAGATLDAFNSWIITLRSFLLTCDRASGGSAGTERQARLMP